MDSATAPVVRRGSQAKVMFFLFFFATTIFVAYLKNARILDPSSPISQHFAPAKWYLAGAVAHVFRCRGSLIRDAYEHINVTVTFSYNGTVLGTINVAAGRAIFSTTVLLAGSDVVTASYAGNANYSGAPAMVKQTVN